MGSYPLQDTQYSFASKKIHSVGLVPRVAFLGVNAMMAAKVVIDSNVRFVVSLVVLQIDTTLTWKIAPVVEYDVEEGVLVVV